MVITFNSYFYHVQTHTWSNYTYITNSSIYLQITAHCQVRLNTEDFK